MFESVELGQTISKAAYERELPGLRAKLLGAQFELGEQKRFPVIIVIGGVDGAGKGETVNLLNEWMDPRHIHTHAFPQPSDEEREWPAMWRFWRALPPRGTIGILFGAWHTAPILDRVMGHGRDARLDQAIEETVRFERMLTDEGALLLKFWFHLSKQQQKKRLLALERHRSTRWRVTDTDWERFARYDRFRRVAERFLRGTSRPDASWSLIEGLDPRLRSLMVGRRILQAMRERLDQKPAARPRARRRPAPARSARVDVLTSLDLSKRLVQKRYERELEHWQGRLNLLSRSPRFQRLSVILVFEGQDAAGKGGAIRRVTQALDARQYRGIAIGAPTEEERAQPYLWRFWRHLPRQGRFTLFDRSWYGRVLVERVEGFCAEHDWMRAYPEINDFEQQLVDHGAVLLKYWLQISKQEQLKRFEAREKTAFKRFKITAEDWRNRKRWGAYHAVVCDMIERTSTEIAPWTLIEANDKLHARIKVLKTLVARIERAI
jgi:polyphosphate:AMP phosphotransferase